MWENSSRQTVTTFSFVDQDTYDQVYVGVTLIGSRMVGLMVSLETDGDYEVFLGSDEISRLIDALQKARDLLNRT